MIPFEHIDAIVGATIGGFVGGMVGSLRAVRRSWRRETVEIVNKAIRDHENKHLHTPTLIHPQERKAP